MPITYPAPPPTKADRDAAAARLALLGGATPARTVSVPARPQDGKLAPDVEANPAYSAWSQAQSSAVTDQAIVNAYDNFATTYASLYSDVSDLVSKGLATWEDRNFAGQYERVQAGA